MVPLRQYVIVCFEGREVAKILAHVHSLSVAQRQRAGMLYSKPTEPTLGITDIDALLPPALTRGVAGNHEGQGQR
ncbi:hypothetical protein CMUS01_07418 [Colletotrichum musicola]|uniref:Uncharacterized protein n=1 Tax=Colletotrichum musicola TaxID=2175873 RepID=A0A8H6NFA2_9PEZI|nr:hypothetical protein CMUS01_07418 [Colletotrichum musicola]